MKLKYPAEAFALGMVLFSAGMKEAFAAGSLMLFTAVFTEFLKNLLETSIPAWSLRLCTCIAGGSVCASAFLLGFSALGLPLTSEFWLMAFAMGLLCARWSLLWGLQGEYGELFLEAAVAWGFWILLAIVREFSGSGQIFGNTMITSSFPSKGLLEPAFAFIAAGLALALANKVLKKDCQGLNGLFPALPALLLIHPFTVDSLDGVWALLWTMAVPAALFWSVQKTLRFSRASRAFRGLPVQMLAAGFIYMILSIY